MNIIGFTGKRGAGKDTAAEALLTRRYAPVKFAGALKAMMHAYLEYIGTNPSQIDRYIEGDRKEFASGQLFCGRSCRYAMQTLGTEWGRDLMSKDLWVRACINRCKLLQYQGSNVVVTDVRFPNEVAGLQGIGGKIIRITRPGFDTDEHESERHINDLVVDHEIINDGTIDDLHSKVLTYI